nr:MAG TPA: hypothetical protein [Caudoviricetes sp.]
MVNYGKAWCEYMIHSADCQSTYSSRYDVVRRYENQRSCIRV